MAVDIGSEIDRQNKALDHVQDDVDELNFRVRGANQRTRHLLGK
ncbi:SNAP25 protein snap33 [Orobanche hederae]